MRSVLAVDIGASSGKAFVGRYNSGRIETVEIHRFTNEPVTIGGVTYWDFLLLFAEVMKSIEIAVREHDIDSVAIDTWAVDFGLLDKYGRLIENPVHYRDKRTLGMRQKSFEVMPESELYRISGNQTMEINTLFQLLSLKEYQPEILQRAETLLMIPDLFNYYLTGNKKSELSNVSTSQIFDQKTMDWSDEIIGIYGLPKKIFTPVIPSGTIVGSCEVCSKQVSVIAVCSHDTQSASFAAPSETKDFLFLSSGTWSLLGTENSEPIINDASLKLDITNERGFDGSASVLKNLTGLWIIQECKRYWEQQGQSLSYAELEKEAVNAKPFKSFIDTQNAVFSSSGKMPEKICDYCIKTKQSVPETRGEIIRTINESLAYKYKKTIGEIMECTGKSYDRLYVMGGGIKSKLLCSMTADATGLEISAGPAEAAAMGNIAVQLIALGDLKNAAEARETIRNSTEITLYKPQEAEKWEKNIKHTQLNSL